MKELGVYGMSGKIQNYRTNFLGHIDRMEEDRIPKKNKIIPLGRNSGIRKMRWRYQ
jgi:hypothetical protein